MTYIKNYCNNNIRLYVSDQNYENSEYIDYSEYEIQNIDNYSNSELDIDLTATALENKFKNSGDELSNKQFEHMSAGSESEIFSAGKKVVKVFCKENLLSKSYDDLKNELEKQQYFLQGINGLAKPLKTDMVEINGKNYPIQVSKYMEHGSLFDIINYDNDYIREESSRFRISIKLALIVSNLHRMGLVHNDLKPENIFLNNNNNVKVGDFSFILELDAKEREPLGTMGYFAPELANCLNKEKTKFKPSLAVDIYSLGVIFFQLFLPNRYECWDNFYSNNIQNYKSLYDDDQRALFECYLGYCKNLINILKNIKKNTDSELYELELYSGRKEPREKLADLMLGMLEMDPKKRLDIKQVKNFLAEIFKLTEKDYNHIKKPIKLKNRELLDLGIINKKLNFEEKEIKKMEKNLILRIKTIINNKNSSNTLKSYMVEIINRIFPENSIKFVIKKDKKLTLKDNLILNGLINQLDNLRIAKIIYCKRRKIHKNNRELAEKFVDTLNGATNLFDIKGQNQKNTLTA